MAHPTHIALEEKKTQREREREGDRLESGQKEVTEEETIQRDNGFSG